MARSQSFRSILILFAVSLFIAACGGGGGSTDRTPNAFNFTASPEAALAEQVESGTITVAGIETAVAISISGGEYSINDGAYTSSAGTVSQGQTVKVRLTASNEFATGATSTVTIGGVTGSYTVTTVSQDTTPENLVDFPNKTLQVRDDVVVSEPITVLDINDGAVVSVSTGGEYSIGAEAFTSGDGEITSGQTIRVRLTAASGFSSQESVTLTIGGVESVFTATTLPQDTTPETLDDFAPKATQGLGAQVVSDPITISNINDATAISVSTGGEYSINGGAFTSESGQVSSGQTVVIRLTASSIFSTQTVVTLTVGGVESEFTATTLLQDTVPETLVDFASIDTQALEDVVNSGVVTISNINDAANVSVSGGAYSIDSGDFTTSAGEISSGQLIRVQVTTSALFSTPATVTLTVGGVEANFTATTLLQDTLPETLVDFASIDTQALEDVVNSGVVTISNINDAADVTVTGGAYSIGSGGFTTSAGQISSGQSIRVQVTTSELFATPATVTLTVGGVEASFTATTAARDVTPKAFTFNDEIDAEFSTLIPSESITVSEINDASPVSVSAGSEYSIDGGAFTSAAGTVNDGQTVQVRDTSSANVSTTVVVTLTIGGVNGTFSITTIADTTAPTAAIIFPSRVSLTEGTTLTIRGSAEDDFSDIESIVVTVGTDSGTIDTVTATSLGDGTFAQWSALVRLGEGEVNTITVTTTDTAEEKNILAEVATVSVTQQSTFDNFPDNSDQFFDVSSGGISLDQANNRLVVTDADSIYAVNLDSGVRIELIDAATMPAVPTKVHVDSDTSQIYISSEPGSVLMLANADGSGINVFSVEVDGVSEPYGLERSTIDGLLYVVDNNGSVYTADTVSGALTSEISFDDNFTLTNPRGLAVVSADIVLIAESGDQSLFSVDISLGDGDGVFTQLLGPSVLSSPQDVEYDSDEARAIIVDSGLGAVLSVPIAGGSMTTISDATTPNANNVMNSPSGITIDGENNIGYVPSYSDSGGDGFVSEIVVVDLVTGERVILSRVFFAF